LYEFSIWEQYEKIILVHCARDKEELTYQDLINSFYNHEFYADMVKDKLKYIKIITRDKIGADLYGRITELLLNNKLEQHVGVDITIENSRLMICGNPEMVDETRKILGARGLTISRRGKPGNMAVENYW
jgi:ferredoxin/flavodoxin---NADP+ reductase